VLARVKGANNGPVPMMAVQTHQRRAHANGDLRTNKASKPLRRAVADGADRPVVNEQVEGRLREIHRLGRMWRDCSKKVCRRTRLCCGYGDDCARRFPMLTAWLQRAMAGEHSGLSPIEAVLAAGPVSLIEVRRAARPDAKAS
jgi:hypothetical protein